MILQQSSILILPFRKNIDYEISALKRRLCNLNNGMISKVILSVSQNQSMQEWSNLFAK